MDTPFDLNITDELLSTARAVRSAAVITSRRSTSPRLASASTKSAWVRMPRSKNSSSSAREKQWRAPVDSNH